MRCNNIRLLAVYNIMKVYNVNFDATKPTTRNRIVRKKLTRTDMVYRIQEIISYVSEKSMHYTAREMNLSDAMIHKIVAEDNRCRSYSHRRGYNFTFTKFFLFYIVHSVYLGCVSLICICI